MKGEQFMDQTPIVLALGFTRGVGKDTLVTHLRALDPRFKRYAFADPLKRDLAPFLLAHFGIDIWTCTPEEKEVIRPILIAYGMCQRARDPDYWVKRTLVDINKDITSTCFNGDLIPVVTDVRFPNEVNILRRELGATIIHVTRDGAPEPTDEEQKHYAGLIPMADLTFHWGGDTEEEQRAHARRLIGQLGIEVEERPAREHTGETSRRRMNRTHDFIGTDKSPK